MKRNRTVSTSIHVCTAPDLSTQLRGDQPLGTAKEEPPSIAVVILGYSTIVAPQGKITKQYLIKVANFVDQNFSMFTKYWRGYQLVVIANLLSPLPWLLSDLYDAKKPLAAALLSETNSKKAVFPENVNCFFPGSLITEGALLEG